MLKKSLLLLYCCGCIGASGKSLPFASRMNHENGYRLSSSGKLAVKQDQAECALRFTHTAPENAKAPWVYPIFVLKEGESLKNAKTLSFEIKIDKPGTVYSLVMLNPGNIRIPYEAPGKEWREIKIDLAAAKTDLSRIRMISIGFNPKTPNVVFHLRNVNLDDGIRLPNAAEMIRMKNDIGGCFFADRIPSFLLDSSCASARQYRLLDYRGTVIRSGIWPENGKGELTFQLDNGYYMLEAEGLGFYRGFAVVPDPAERIVNPDSFFCLGAISAWGSRRCEHSRNRRWPSDATERCAELLRIAGVPLVRDFNSWRANQKAPNQYTFLDFFDHTANLLQKRKIGMATFFEGTPNFLRRNRSGFFPRFPDDLIGTFDFMKKFAEHYAGKVDVLEYFNEPDIKNWPEEPVWDFVSAAKAASLGFRAGNQNAVILNGSLAHLGTYPEMMFENELQEYIDAFNVHNYSAPEVMRMEIMEWRALLKRRNLEGLPFFVTETGSQAEGYGRTESWVPGLKEHSAKQAMLVAELLPKQYITLQSCGVNKAFYFCLIPKNEQNGNKVWGMLGYDFTVKPAFAALATLTRELGNAEYLGELELGKGIRAFLYRQQDGSQSIACWSDSEIDTCRSPLPENIQQNLHRKTAYLKAAAGRYTRINFLGTPDTLTASGGTLTFETTRFPAYIHGLSGLTAVQRPPAETVSRTKSSGKDLSVIFKTRLSKDFHLAADKCSFDLLSDAPAAFQLEIHNLDTVDKIGQVFCAGAEVTGLPASVKVPARSWIKLDLKMIPPAKERTAIRLTGIFNGKSVTRHAMVCIRSKYWEHIPLLRASEAKNWISSSGGVMKISDDPQEKAVRFDTSIPNAKARWCYPIYPLQLPEESLKNAFAIEFEIKYANGTLPPSLSLVMLSDHGYLHHLRYSAEAGKWKKCQIQIQNVRSSEAAAKEVKPERIDRIMIGLNPRAEKTTYWLRNIQLIRRPER